MKNQFLAKSLIMICLLLFPAAVMANQSDTIIGNGKIVTAKRDTADFSALNLNGSFDIKIKTGKKRYVEITTDSNIIDHIKTQKEHKKLYIYSDKSYSSQHGVKVEIEIEKLNDIELNGSNSGIFDNISSDSFAISVNGASSFTLKGDIKNLTANVNGGSSLNADMLKASNVKINLNGAASAEVNASKLLDVSIVGACSVSYSGNPEIRRQIIGVGSIEPK